MKLSQIVALGCLGLASAGNAVTVDFESGSAGAAIGTLSGAVFTDGFYKQCGGGCPAPVLGLFASSSDSASPFTVTFTSLQSTVSFINVSYSNVLANAYDSSNVLVDFLVNTTGGGASGPLSLNGSGISYVVFSAASGQFGIDNLSFAAGAVPEPASWAMLIAGFGLVGAAMRHRKLAAA